MTEVLRLRIPARPEYLVLGRLVLAGLARCRPLHPDDVSDLKLALTEACTNAMRHAYDDGDGEVEIAYILDEGALTIEVQDDGPGFEPAPALPGDALNEGGLGLAIIAAVTEVVELGPRAEGIGSRLVFRKKLSDMPIEEP